LVQFADGEGRGVKALAFFPNILSTGEAY
jgi:hypothetical protein